MGLQRSTKRSVHVEDHPCGRDPTTDILTLFRAKARPSGGSVGASGVHFVTDRLDEGRPASDLAWSVCVYRSNRFGFQNSARPLSEERVVSKYLTNTFVGIELAQNLKLNSCVMP